MQIVEVIYDNRIIGKLEEGKLLAALWMTNELHLWPSACNYYVLFVNRDNGELRSVIGQENV